MSRSLVWSVGVMVRFKGLGLGCGVQGVRLRVWGREFVVEGSEFGDWGLGFRVQGFGLRVGAEIFRFGVQGLGIRARVGG